MHLIDDLAYFATVVSSVRKMFIKSTPGVNLIKLFTSLLRARQNKLECLSFAISAEPCL
jgi:hypothetical protein